MHYSYNNFPRPYIIILNFIHVNSLILNVKLFLIIIIYTYFSYQLALKIACVLSKIPFYFNEIQKLKLNI